jgi:sugar lactone lactonase YvrE
MHKVAIAQENSGHGWVTLAIVALASTGAFAQAGYYKAIDFTAENLFSENIEGPNFDAKGHLYVVNFQKDGAIGKVDAHGNVSLFVTLPYNSVANSIVFSSQGTMLLADWKGHNILRVNMKNRAVGVLCHKAFNQPNDLAINKKDQLFASDPNWKEETGKLWRIEPDGETTLLKDDMGTTNGIELSPDEKTLYVNESVQLKIWAFDVDDKGNISNQRLFSEFDDYGLDGMKCDEKGNLYVTRYGKGTVAILNPRGQLIREVDLKGEKPSNLVFGGRDGKTVYVTLQDRKCIEIFRSEFAGKRFKK